MVDTFIEQKAEVAAGVRQIEAVARRQGGLRLLGGHFMVVQQAMGVPKSRGAEAAAFLGQFDERMKAGGFLAPPCSAMGFRARPSRRLRRFKTPG